MTELNCESVCMAAMAMADGFPSAMSDLIETHLRNCSECRREVGQQRALSELLGAQRRPPQDANIWTSIEWRLPDAREVRKRSLSWYPFIPLGVLLLGYRLIEMVPDRDLSPLFKFVPILFIIAAFGYLKENPFKINAALTLEGE